MCQNHIFSPSRKRPSPIPKVLGKKSCVPCLLYCTVLYYIVVQGKSSLIGNFLLKKMCAHLDVTFFFSFEKYITDYEKIERLYHIVTYA